MPESAFKICKPTSIATTGSAANASIGEHGRVIFSLCNTLSLNEVFTSSYDNYVIILRVTSSEVTDITAKLRTNNTDNTSSYVYQKLTVDSTTLTSARATTTLWEIGRSGSTPGSGGTFYLFGPNLPQATSYRSTFGSGLNSAIIYDYGGTHGELIAYNGISIIPSGGTITGQLTVYGCNQ